MTAARISSGQIVSPAKTPLKSEPAMTSTFVAFGAVVGALLAVGVIALRSMLMARFPTARSLAYATGMPSLGSLPSFGQAMFSRRPALMEIEGPSPIGETLRGMRLTLQNLARPGAGTVVLVTSAEAGEGKTTVAAAMARRAAGDGLRVLLIEGDLRCPTLSQVFPAQDNGAELGGYPPRQRKFPVRRSGRQPVGPALHSRAGRPCRPWCVAGIRAMGRPFGACQAELRLGGNGQPAGATRVRRYLPVALG